MIKIIFPHIRSFFNLRKIHSLKRVVQNHIKKIIPRELTLPENSLTSGL